jgi:hypothetical protein
MDGHGVGGAGHNSPLVEFVCWPFGVSERAAQTAAKRPFLQENLFKSPMNIIYYLMIDKYSSLFPLADDWFSIVVQTKSKSCFLLFLTQILKIIL